MVGLCPLQIQRRFTAAARAAGIEACVTAHSGRVGLASELTARGASTTEVTGDRAVSSGRGAAHELRLVFEALTALSHGDYTGGVPVAYTVEDLLRGILPRRHGEHVSER